jgi:hypothetical protein
MDCLRSYLDDGVSHFLAYRGVTACLGEPRDLNKRHRALTFADLTFSSQSSEQRGQIGRLWLAMIRPHLLLSNV